MGIVLIILVASMTIRQIGMDTTSNNKKSGIEFIVPVSIQVEDVIFIKQICVK